MLDSSLSVRPLGVLCGAAGEKKQTKPGLLAEPENIYQGIRDRSEKLCCAASDGLRGKERWRQGVER